MVRNTTGDGPVPGQPAADPLRRAERLRRGIESISGELALEPLLTRIIEGAATLLGADYGSIGLVTDEADRPVVRLAAVFNTPPELAAEVPSGVGLAGRVLLEGRAIRLDRYGDLDRPVLPGLGEHTVIGMPIRWSGRLIGVFGLGAAPPRRFSARDSRTLALFARHAAIAIENARRYERERRRSERLALIARIGRLITGPLGLEQILQTAVDAIHEHLGFRNIALLLVDPADPTTLVRRARNGIYNTHSILEYRQPIEAGIVGAAARARQPLLVDDVRGDPRYIPIPGAEAIRAELAAPLVVGDRLLGVLNIESEGPIGDDDAAGIAIIADQLGVAIQNAHLFAGMQRALEEMRLLAGTSQRISAAMTVDEVIGAYLDQVAARGRYVCTVALYELDAAGRPAAVVVRGRWSPREGVVHLEQRLSHTRDALDPPLDAGQTVAIADVHSDPRVSAGLRRIQARDRRPALALIPLMARGQRIGLVILSYPAVHQWHAADLQPYEATAAQLATAIDRRRQQLLLSERGQQLAVLEERQRLARDLHDSVTQLIFSGMLIAQSIAPAWRREPDEGERRVGRLLEVSQSALAEMRALLAELRPTEPQPGSAGAAGLPGTMGLRRDGLAAALRGHVAGIACDGPKIGVDTSGYTPQRPATEEALYYIAREALHNAVKHARAGRVTLRLRADGDVIRLRVEDDGIGFAPAGSRAKPGPRPDPGDGFGLRTMRERAEALGGAVLIGATPGGGTRVEALVPGGGSEEQDRAPRDAVACSGVAPTAPA